MKICFIAAAAKIGLGLTVLLTLNHAARSAEVKVLSVRPLKPLLDALGPGFEQQSGHKLTIQYNVSAALKRQIDVGEAFDVALILPGMIDDLLKQGKIATATRTDIARAAIAVAVKKGAAKPDIGTTEALKRTLLDAKSVAYSEEGGSGIYFKSVLERLGIAAEMNPKLRPLASAAVVPALMKGEAELAVISPPAILAEPGVELVGLLPKALQHYVIYTAGVSAAAKETEAAKALLKHLTTPAALSVMKTKGLEPVVPQ